MASGFSSLVQIQLRLAQKRWMRRQASSSIAFEAA
jgi:hypothetical protein